MCLMLALFVVVVFYDFAGTCTENFHSTTTKTKNVDDDDILIILIKSHWLNILFACFQFTQKLVNFFYFDFSWFLFFFSFCLVLFFFSLFWCRIKRTKTGWKRTRNRFLFSNFERTTH